VGDAKCACPPGMLHVGASLCAAYAGCQAFGAINSPSHWDLLIPILQGSRSSTLLFGVLLHLDSTVGLTPPVCHVILSGAHMMAVLLSSSSIHDTISSLCQGPRCRHGRGSRVQCPLCFMHVELEATFLACVSRVHVMRLLDVVSECQL
jgi:hypothetical protein